MTLHAADTLGVDTVTMITIRNYSTVQDAAATP